MCNWGLYSSSWCSAITSSLPVGTCCLTPEQCERHQKWLSDTLLFKLQQYLLVFDDTGEMQLGAGPSPHRGRAQSSEWQHPFFLTHDHHTQDVLVSNEAPVAGVHSAQNPTVVWQVMCSSSSSVQLLRYLTKSALTCSDHGGKKRILTHLSRPLHFHLGPTI